MIVKNMMEHFYVNLYTYTGTYEDYDR